MGTVHPITVTFLEMHEEPRLRIPLPAGRIAIIRAHHPPVHFYRYLYDAVGREYVWVNRKRLSDDELAEIVQDPQVELYVLYVEGAPAGYAELDFRKLPDVELAFFGLMPEFLGRGLGKYLLGQAIKLAWARNPRRLHVQTCTLDHPSALPLYQKCGFVPFAQEETTIEDLDHASTGEPPTPGNAGNGAEA